MPSRSVNSRVSVISVRFSRKPFAFARREKVCEPSFSMNTRMEKSPFLFALTLVLMPLPSM